MLHYKQKPNLFIMKHLFIMKLLFIMKPRIFRLIASHIGMLNRFITVVNPPLSFFSKKIFKMKN